MATQAAQATQLCDGFIPSKQTAKLLMGAAQSGDVDAFLAVLETFCQQVDHQARSAELWRVKAATLDADIDVWSLTDTGQVISLNDRLRQL